MTFWQKITIGTKFLFGGFESATDYALGLLNTFLSTASPTVAWIVKAVTLARTVYGYLVKYAEYCPSKWRDEYSAVLDAVSSVTNSLSDLKLTSDEIKEVTCKFKAVHAAWMED